MASRTSNLADVSAQFLSSVVGRGCYLVLQVFLARDLGPREFGLYAIGWTVAGLVGTLTPVGMPQVMLRYKVTGRRALSALPMVICAVIGLLGGIAVTALADLLARAVFGDPSAAPAIRALAPSIPLTGVFWVLTSALRASGENLASAILGTLLFVVYLLATAVAFRGGLGQTPSMAGHMYTFAIAVSVIPAIWLLYRQPSASHMPPVGQMLQFGVVTMFISSANLLNLWADRVIIGMMADAKAVGIYQVASQLAVVAIVLRSAVITVFEARVPKPVAGHTPNVSYEYVAASRLLLHLSAPGLVCLCLTATFWITLLFGPAYATAALPLAVLVVGQLALTFAGPAVNALHMSGDEHMAMRLTTGVCVLNILANIALIPSFGLAGSAAASGLANMAVGGISLWRLRRTGRLEPYFARIADIVFATMLSGAAMLLALYLLGPASLATMVLTLLAGYLVYAVSVLILCQDEDEAIAFIRSTFRRLNQRKVGAP